MSFRLGASAAAVGVMLVAVSSGCESTSHRTRDDGGSSGAAGEPADAETGGSSNDAGSAAGGAAATGGIGAGGAAGSSSGAGHGGAHPSGGSATGGVLTAGGAGEGGAEPEGTGAAGGPAGGDGGEDSAGGSAGTATAGEGGGDATAGAAGSTGEGGSDATGGSAGTAGGGEGGSGPLPCADNADCSGSTPFCLDGSCVECEPEVEQCASPTSLERCDASGAWQPVDIDFNFDAEHCGSCGHSCLGGDCSAQVCQPLRLASGEGAPTGITLDDDYVYYVCPRTEFVRRVPKSGGVAAQTIANNRVDWPRDITYAVGYLFFTEGDYVYRMLPDGSEAPTVWYPATWTAETLTQIDTDYGQNGVADIDARLIWSGSSYVLEELALSDGRGAFVEQGGPGDPGAVAIDPDFFFWSRMGSGHNNGYIRARTRTSSPTNIAIADLVGHVVALTFDGTYLYWAMEGLDDEDTAVTTDVLPNTGAIFRAEFVSGTQTWLAPVPVIENINRPWDIIVDDEWVYWTSLGDSTVNQVAKSGGSPVVLASDQGLPWYLAQDELSIYWTNSSYPSGTVMRLAK